MTASTRFRDSPSTASKGRDRIGAAFILFGALLLCCGLWIIAPYLVRPEPPYYSFSLSENAVAQQNSRALKRAAYLGFPRGTLWADYAVALMFELESSNPRSVEKIDHVRSAATLALHLAPLEARAWLVLAKLAALASGDARGALRMSFLAAPNAGELSPDRLAIAARLYATDDPDLRDLMERDLRLLKDRPDVTALFAELYRAATPQAKTVIEKAVKEIDPTLWITLRPTH